MITVIYISKGKIIGCRVNEGNQKVTDSFEVGWDLNTLDISLNQVIEKIKNKKIRILLDDFYSYVLRFSVPKNLNGSEERKFISGQIAEKIPEFLTDKDWDYKEISFSLSQGTAASGSIDKDVVVFSPVKYISNLLSKAVASLGLEVEAIEPVEIASTRNTNPIVGLALKEDLNGSDREVLNVSINKGLKSNDFKDVIEDQPKEKPDNQMLTPKTQTQPPEPLSGQEDVEKKPRAKKIILTLLLILVIISFLSLLAFFVYRDFFSKEADKNGEAILPTPTLTTEVTNTPVPTEEESINLSQYKVLVKNGSGVAGEAQNAVSLLKDVGYTQFETTNAFSYDYVKTQIAVKDGFPVSALEETTNTLSQDYDVASESSVLKDSEYDVEVIVGVKK